MQAFMLVGMLSDKICMFLECQLLLINPKLRHSKLRHLAGACNYYSVYSRINVTVMWEVHIWWPEKNAHGAHTMKIFGMWVTSRWIMDRLNSFNLNSIRKVAEEKMMMLRHWAVGPSVNNSFPEHISESTCRIVFKFYTQHLYWV